MCFQNLNILSEANAIAGIAMGLGAQTGLLGISVSTILNKMGLGWLVAAYFNFIVWDSRPFSTKVTTTPGWLNWLPRSMGSYFDLEIVRYFRSGERVTIGGWGSHEELNDQSGVQGRLNPSLGPYMFCMHPHGIFGFGPQVTAPLLNTAVSPGLRIKHAGVKAVFYLPIFRELAIAFNTFPVDEDLMRKALSEGVSVTVVVGGAAEALLSSYPGVTPIVLKGRKGFVRLAVESGAKLVPCYNFGEEGTYSQVFNDKLRGVQSVMMDKLGFSLPVLRPNRWFAPLFPKKGKFTMVIGDPLDSVKVSVNDKDFEKAVDKLHEQYVERVVELHARNAAKYGSQDEQRILIVSSQDAKDLAALRAKI